MCDHIDGPGVKGKPGLAQMKGKSEPGCYGEPLADEETGSEKFSHPAKFLLSHAGSKVLTPKEHCTWVRLTHMDLLGNYLRYGCRRCKHSDRPIYCK